MTRKILVLMLVVGLLMGFVVSSVSAQEEPPPRPPGEEPPPRPDCELEEWELFILGLLAKRFDVEQVEMEGWYCSGFSFGEIAFVYQISLKSETPVEDIFAMLEQDMTWIEILVAVGLIEDWPPGDRLVPPVVREFPGRFPFGGDICMENGSNPRIELLAEMYGLSYEEAYQWICGPYTYTNFNGWVEMEFRGSRSVGPQLGLDVPNIREELKENPFFDEFEDLLTRLPKGRLRP
jgi:hypothetical protein